MSSRDAINGPSERTNTIPSNGNDSPRQNERTLSPPHSITQSLYSLSLDQDSHSPAVGDERIVFSSATRHKINTNSGCVQCSRIMDVRPAYQKTHEIFTDKCLESLGYILKRDYEKEYRFTGLRYPGGDDLRKEYKFDRYFKRKNLVIEVDEQAHFNNRVTKENDRDKTLRLLYCTDTLLLRLDHTCTP